MNSTFGSDVSGPLEELVYKISRFKDPPAELTGLRPNTLEISVRK